MTEEQIKQNAEAYASKKYDRHYPLWEMIRDIFITGAHSMLEEIEALHQEVNELSQAYYGKCAEVDQLRNPWISVEERLPEIDQTQHTKKKNMSVAVLVHDIDFLCDSLGQVFSPSVCRYDYERKDWLYVELGCYANEIELGAEITHWMPIPELKKGE